MMYLKSKEKERKGKFGKSFLRLPKPREEIYVIIPASLLNIQLIGFQII